jgi:fructose PTS system EIIBC or EIIC component
MPDFMNIHFDTEHIIPELKGGGSSEVIDELTGQLAAVSAILPANTGEIAAAIKQRERSMSTGIGLGLALPHALSYLVDQPVVAFGRSKTGIDFDALDRQPVHLVAMIVVPADERARSLEMLAAISRLLHRKELCSALKMAADAAAMAEILNGRRKIPMAAAIQGARAGTDYA